LLVCDLTSLACAGGHEACVSCPVVARAFFQGEARRQRQP
jgi:hypothetical protein